MTQDEMLVFDDPAVPTTGHGVPASLPPWRVLVVDDDADVHESTGYALRGIDICDRQVELLHVHSGAQAIEMLRHQQDVAVILLDVVMETDDAGLRTVETIRNELGLHNVRIVLRTGQPGQAPEIETIRRYDINDYKTKSELTRGKLYATVTTAVRSYDQLRRLDASRRGLEQIVAASNQFIAENGMLSFAEGVIMQIAGLIGIDPEGLVCACADPDASRWSPEDFIVIAAAGQYRHLIRRHITEIDDASIVDSLTQCLSERRSLLAERSITMFFPGRGSCDFAAHIAAPVPLREVDQHLLEVFCTNIALCADNVELVRKLREFAFVDRLLRIPNRTALIQHLDAGLAGDGLAGRVLVLIDIDQFAETNDMFGHRFGDLLLRAIALRLTEALAEHCFVARMAGNTFAVLGAKERVGTGTLRTLFASEFEVEGVACHVSVCMGLVECLVGHEDGSGLLQDASIALKRAKTGGQGRCESFTAELGADSKERTRLLHGLHRAIDHQRLFLAYQPQIDLATGQVVGNEALLRWLGDDGSPIAPDRFIPLAERSGLIVNLGAWVLRTALMAQARLGAAGHTGLRMAVNVSPVQFGHAEFLRELDQALRDSGVPPAQLELEITESVSIMGMEPAAALLREVRARGVRVAIDDFGTGYSSLSYLDCLPADVIKIDRAFTARLDSDRPGARIARMVVAIGHQLDMKVLAEGVESEAQAGILRDLGCDEAQGYLFARPMPFESLLPWLAGPRK